MEKVKLKSNADNSKYAVTINALRTQNFRKNLPFLILAKNLPEGQVYREFCDGRIEQQEVFVEGTRYNHKVIRILSKEEAEAVRLAHGLH